MEDIPVRTGNIIAYAVSINTLFKSFSAKLLSDWVYRFMRRYNLSLRQVTHRGQKLSGHLKSIKVDTTTAINKRFALGGILFGVDPQYFLNMDQTAVYFETKSATVVAKKGKKYNPVRDSGSNAKLATVCVTIAADGTKLPPFFVFIGKPGATVEQQILELGVKGCCQEKGCFASNVPKNWIKHILEPYVAPANKACLLIDHFSVHLTSDFCNTYNDLGVDVEYIPKRYTGVLQPVDVGFNSLLKRHVRDMHHKWCILTYKGIANAATLPTPERETFIEWVVYVFSKINATTIFNTFKHIGVCASGTISDENNNSGNVDELLFTNQQSTVVTKDLMLLPRPHLHRKVSDFTVNNEDETLFPLKEIVLETNISTDTESNDGDLDFALLHDGSYSS